MSILNDEFFKHCRKLTSPKLARNGDDEIYAQPPLQSRFTDQQFFDMCAEELAQLRFNLQREDVTAEPPGDSQGPPAHAHHGLRPVKRKIRNVERSGVDDPGKAKFIDELTERRANTKRLQAFESA